MTTTLTPPAAPAPARDVTEAVVRPSLAVPIAMAVMAGLTALMAIFTAEGTSTIRISTGEDIFTINPLNMPGRVTAWVLFGCVAVCAGLSWFYYSRLRKTPMWVLSLGGVFAVLAVLILISSGKSQSVPLTGLLGGTLFLATPLVFGALSGVVCERVGIINIAIEGQLMFGAFAAAVVASSAGNSYYGLIAAPAAGAIVAVLLAWFSITFKVNQIVVGVVLNMLVLGLTSFLFSTVLRETPSANMAMSLPTIDIPILAGIPIIGPVLFRQNLLVYAMYLLVIGLQIMIFRSRWGLRLRSVGEHPKAADTVGINVNRTRWRNTILGGAIAGLGGAFFTVASGLAFGKDMTAGKGFIALAAMIMGRWSPKGAVAAALLFGFSDQLRLLMSNLQVSLPPQFLLMLPYLVTIFAVAGFAGTVRAPASEGIPYEK